jgi:hypothetical protein
MAKKYGRRSNRSNNGARNRRNDTSTGLSRTQVASKEMNYASGIRVPDHELSVIGLGNVNRFFDLDETGNGPSAVFRTVHPLAAFWQGYSLGTVGDQDVTSATNIILTGVDPLYAITPFAQAVETDVWPIIQNLFASGTGLRPTITIHEFVRYNAMMLKAYSALLWPIMVNHLAFRFNWRMVYPFTDVVPSWVWQLVENLECTDSGLAVNYLSYMKRMENKVMFPRLIQEVKRMMSPMLSVDLQGRLQIPSYWSPSAVAADVTLVLDNLINYIDGNLTAAGNLFASFLPFPFKASLPWDLSPMPVVDIDRDSGWYNSGVKNMDVFGDTGDPDKLGHLTVDEAGTDKCLFFTRQIQPLWSEVRMASIWRLTTDVDDEFWLITPHKHQNVYLIDDAFDAFNFDGSDVTAASLGYRYLPFANVRYATDLVTQGMQKPGTSGALLSKETLDRMIRLDVSYLFNVEILKTVAMIAAGSSIRELRYTIRTMVEQEMASPV